MANEDIIKGSDGRSYVRGKDGRLSELFDPAAHAARQLKDITADHTITGLRLSSKSKPNDPAIVVTFNATEAALVVKAVQQVLAARAKSAPVA